MIFMTFIGAHTVRIKRTPKKCNVIPTVILLRLFKWTASKICYWSDNLIRLFVTYFASLLSDYDLTIPLANSVIIYIIECFILYQYWWIFFRCYSSLFFQSFSCLTWDFCWLKSNCHSDIIIINISRNFRIRKYSNHISFLRFPFVFLCFGVSYFCCVLSLSRLCEKHYKNYDLCAMVCNNKSHLT